MDGTAADFYNAGLIPGRQIQKIQELHPPPKLAQLGDFEKRAVQLTEP